MSIITISRGSFSRGKEIAEKVAKQLNYENVSREILLEASDVFNIPEIKLFQAVHDAPSILGRFTFGRQRYLAHVESALLDHLKRDNVVYHGLAGHFFVRGISHVLKVRVIADFEDRVKKKMEQEGAPRREAVEDLKKDDQERRQWSLKLYGIDTWDPSLYDLVLHIHKLTTDDAAEIICHTAGLRQFRTTPQSQRAMDDLALAARVKTRIVAKYPNSKVSATAGDVLVHVEASETLEQKILDDIECMAREVPGVSKVTLHLVPTTLVDGRL